MKTNCPAQVDLNSRYEVTRYIRDLINLSDLLENGFDNELAKFTKQLKEAGWGRKEIASFIEKACHATRYEFLTNEFGDKIVPANIPEVGDRIEWNKNKNHWKK